MKTFCKFRTTKPISTADTVYRMNTRLTIGLLPSLCPAPLLGLLAAFGLLDTAALVLVSRLIYLVIKP